MGDAVMYDKGHSELNSYQEVDAYFSRARNPEKGRPFRNWGMINKDGDVYELKFRWAYTNQDTICYIYPNNTIEFVYPKDSIGYHGTTLVGSFTRGLPMIFTRVKTGKYRLTHNIIAFYKFKEIEKECEEHNKNLRTPQESDENLRGLQLSGMYDHMQRPREWRYPWQESWRWMRNKPNQEYFEGIKFDLGTGECLNPREDLEVHVNPENRKEWLRIVKKYKRGLRLRAKTQVFTSLLQDAVNERLEEKRKGVFHGTVPKVNLADTNNVAWVADCMKKDEYPVKLLEHMVAHMYDQFEYGWWNLKPYTHKEVLKNIDKIFDRLSIPLREKFNVFKGDIRP